MTSLSRRGFLRTGLTGAAGIALAPGVIKASSRSPQDNIIYRTLGKTGMKVPVVSFGVMRSDNSGLCKAAYEKGIKLFDTANGYRMATTKRCSAICSRTIRNSFCLATK
jgi:hypothetical protein